jgi:hypothetical protein
MPGGIVMGSRVVKGMQKGFVLLIGSALAMAAGCDDTPYTDASACQQGDTRECVGPGACKGAQECLPTGLGFASCECADDGTPNGGGSGEAGTTSQGGTGGDAVGGMQTNPGGAAGAGGTGEPTVDGGAGGAGGTGGAPIEYACDPIGNVGCSTSQNCSLDGAERACVPAGTKTLLAKCDLTSECAPGLLCHLHNCVQPCTKVAQCTATDPSTTCTMGVVHSDVGIDVIGACLKSCDIISQNCPVGQACYLGFCMTPASAGTQGSSCATPTDCAKGFACLAEGGCQPYCATSAQDPCPTGLSCSSLQGDLPNAPAEWGVCIEG